MKLSFEIDENELPTGWEVAQVKQIAEIVRGVTYKKADAQEVLEVGFLPVLRATNIQDGSLVLDKNLVFVPSELISVAQTLRAGDIVVATSSGSKHLVGKTAQVKSEWKGSFGAFCAAIRPSDEIEPRYLGYFFESPAYKSYIAAKAMGVNINNLRRGDLEDITVPIAPSEQQKRIVAEIEKQFSRLDEAVANLKRVKANLKRYKAAVLKSAVEGKLTGEDPSKWESALLGKVATTIRNGYSLKPDAESGTRIFRISAVRPLILHLDDVRYLSGPIDDYSKHVVTEGDVLFTRYNGNPELVGVCAVVPKKCPATVHPDKLIRVSVPKEILLPEMLALLASAGEGREYIRSKIRTTAGQSGISGGDLKVLPLRIPPLTVQQGIIFEVERCLSIVAGTEIQIEANLRRAERLRQSILKKAFSGQIIVNI